MPWASATLGLIMSRATATINTVVNLAAAAHHEQQAQDQERTVTLQKKRSSKKAPPKPRVTPPVPEIPIPGWKLCTGSRKKDHPLVAATTGQTALLPPDQPSFTFGVADWFGDGVRVPQSCYSALREDQPAIALATPGEVRAALARPTVQVPQALLCISRVDDLGKQIGVPGRAWSGRHETRQMFIFQLGVENVTFRTDTPTEVPHIAPDMVRIGVYALEGSTDAGA